MDLCANEHRLPSKGPSKGPSKSHDILKLKTIDYCPSTVKNASLDMIHEYIKYAASAISNHQHLRQRCHAPSKAACARPVEMHNQRLANEYLLMSAGRRRPAVSSTENHLMFLCRLPPRHPPSMAAVFTGQAGKSACFCAAAGTQPVRTACDGPGEHRAWPFFPRLPAMALLPCTNGHQIPCSPWSKMVGCHGLHGLNVCTPGMGNCQKRFPQCRIPA